MFIFILSTILIAWIAFIFGFCFISTHFDQACQFKKQLWNGRIDKLNKQPFSSFMKAYASKNYMKSFLMVIVCNLLGHMIMFLSGYIKIGFIMILIQPFMQGAVVGMGDDKTRMWGIFTAIFEVSGLILSCCLGFMGTIEYWWLSMLLLILNGIVEAGGIYVGIKGVPGIDAVKDKTYI